MGNFRYNPINISRVIKKNQFYAFFKCPHNLNFERVLIWADGACNRIELNRIDQTRQLE